MIRFSQLQIRIVKVMTHFVQKRTEKRLERDNLATFRCPHPYLNGVTWAAAPVLRVETMKLAATIGRTHAVHVDSDCAYT